MTPWLDDDDGPCMGVCAGCDESCALLAVPTAIDWSAFRKCPVCFAETGQPCLSLSGFNAGRAVAVATEAPHSSRKPKTGALT